MARAFDIGAIKRRYRKVAAVQPTQASCRAAFNEWSDAEANWAAALFVGVETTTRGRVEAERKAAKRRLLGVCFK
jgi:hypothetical protein